MNASTRHVATLAAFGLMFTLPQAASAADPCTLMRVQDIVAVLGNRVSPTPIGTTGCIWKGNPQGVNIQLSDASTWARTIMPVQGVTKTAVSGIGDAAIFSGIQNTWTLSVKQGNNVIVLTVLGTNTSDQQRPDQQRSLEQALALLALKGL